MKSVSLGPLEQEVMNILWERKRCTVRYVLNSLNRKKHLAYTTVMTIMGRMVDKGVLERTLRGSRYLYQPKVSKNNFIAGFVHSVFSTTVSSFGHEAVAYFVKEIKKLEPRKRKQLLELLDDKN